MLIEPLSTKIKPPITVRSSDTARRLLISRKGTPGRTWRWLAQNVYWPVPAGTLCAIAKGEKIPNRYRRVFKLPAIVKREVCPLHGVVHDYDCQTQEVKPRSNGRPKRKRERLAISKHDPASAARSMRRNLTAEMIEGIMEELRDGYTKKDTA
jgi:hypothetical protein